MTIKESVCSLFTMHNQTLNTFVMVMLLPMAIVYAFVSLYVFSVSVATHIAIIFMIQWWSEAPFSIAYHTLQSINLDVAKRLCRLDYMSIYWACPLALYINTYYAFNDFVILRIVLMTISLTVSAGYIIMTLSSYYDTFCMSRINMCSGVVIQVTLNLFPIFYSEYMDGWGHSGLFATLILINFILCIMIWLNHLPERWVPYKFDKSTHSHTVMHIHILVFQGLQFAYIVAAAIEYQHDIVHSF